MFVVSAEELPWAYSVICQSSGGKEELFHRNTKNHNKAFSAERVREKEWNGKEGRRGSKGPKKKEKRKKKRRQKYNRRLIVRDGWIQGGKEGGKDASSGSLEGDYTTSSG